jgi:hypothetical protein
MDRILGGDIRQNGFHTGYGKVGLAGNTTIKQKKEAAK